MFLVHLLDLELVEICDRYVLSTSLCVFCGVISHRKGVGSTNGLISIMEYGF